MHEQTHALSGADVLVVEDDYLIAMQIGSVLADAGARITGPARSIEDALRLIEGQGISAAILDVRIGNRTIDRVARKLLARNVPLIFYTAQLKSESFHSQWPNCRTLSKPATAEAIVT